MKKEYLEELKKELIAINYEDVEDTISYFEQIFEDKLSEGFSQEEIIEHLDKPKEVASQLNDEKNSDFGYEEVEYHLEDDEKVIVEYDVNDCLKISIENVMLDIDIRKSETEKVRIIYPKNNNYYYNISYHKNKLDIEYQEDGHNFFNKSKVKRHEGTLIIELPNLHYTIDIENLSGNISISDQFFNKFNLENVSGAIKLHNLEGHEFNLETISGHLESADNLKFIEMNLEGVSSNIMLSNTNATELNIETVSGNIDLDVLGDLEDYSLKISKLFKDISLNNDKRRNGYIELESVSGKINYNFHN